MFVVLYCGFQVQINIRCSSLKLPGEFGKNKSCKFAEMSYHLTAMIYYADYNKIINNFRAEIRLI